MPRHERQLHKNLNFTSFDASVELVTNLLKAGQVPCLIAEPGMGRTAILRKVAKTMEASLIDYRDLDSEELRWKWVGGPILAILDNPVDIDETLALLRRRSADRPAKTDPPFGGKLHLVLLEDIRQESTPGSFTWSTTLPKAIEDLVTLVPVLQKPSEWVRWAAGASIHPAIIAVVHDQAYFLDGVTPRRIVDFDLALKTLDRDSLREVALHMFSDNPYGQEFTCKVDIVQNLLKKLPIDAILSDPDGVAIPGGIDVHTAAVYLLAELTTLETADAVGRYIRRLPSEQQYLFSHIVSKRHLHPDTIKALVQTGFLSDAKGSFI